MSIPPDIKHEMILMWNSGKSSSEINEIIRQKFNRHVANGSIKSLMKTWRDKPSSMFPVPVPRSKGWNERKTI